eukprot:344817-Hanusia_phi.AAC.1
MARIPPDLHAPFVSSSHLLCPLSRLLSLASSALCLVSCLSPPLPRLPSPLSLTAPFPARLRQWGGLGKRRAAPQRWECGREERGGGGEEGGEVGGSSREEVKGGI